MPEHLHSAARALERILANKWPEYTWVVDVGQPDPRQPGAMPHDPDTVLHRDTLPAAGRGDEHRLDEAA